jgi:hypothetical protein
VATPSPEANSRFSRPFLCRPIPVGPSPSSHGPAFSGRLFLVLPRRVQRADYLDASNSVEACHGSFNLAEGGNDSGIFQLAERLDHFPPESFEVFASVSVRPGTFAVPDLSQNLGLVASSCREALVHISQSFGSFYRTRKIFNSDALVAKFFEGFAVIVDSLCPHPLSFGVPAKPSALVDTRVIYCGDNLD